jgi:hypothetical protein
VLFFFLLFLGSNRIKLKRKLIRFLLEDALAYPTPEAAMTLLTSNASCQNPKSPDRNFPLQKKCTARWTKGFQAIQTLFL